MTMNDPIPLAVAEEDVVDHAREMAPIARLAAHGMRMGRQCADHPTSHVRSDESATRLGMRVTLDPADPFLAACGAEVRDGLIDFHLVLDVEHQFVRFLLLPLDRSRPACIVVWSMREDRSELDFGDVAPTNHDVAAIADHAAAMLESVVDVSTDEAMAGMAALEDAANTLRRIAFAELGIDVHVTVMANDPGSDLVVIAYAMDDPSDVHFAMPLRIELAQPQAQMRIGIGSTGALTMSMPDGGDAEWPSRFEYTVNRRSAGSSRADDGDDAPDVVDAMRVRRRFAHLPPPLAILDTGSDDGQNAPDDE